MLAELHDQCLGGAFLKTFLVICVLEYSFSMAMKIRLFMRFYARPTYEQWRRKTVTRFPEPQHVRQEVLTYLVGAWPMGLMGATSFHLARHGWSRAYVGLGDHGVCYLLLTVVAVTLLSDLYEYFEHWLGHAWRPYARWVHHEHHKHYNPTPFAGNADSILQCFFRCLPCVAIPLLMPVNLDVLFAVRLLLCPTCWSTGYLHLGFEFDGQDNHFNRRIFFTNYHHNVHHTKSKGKRVNIGAWLQLWDRLFGTLYEGECACAECQDKQGARSKEAWLVLHKPDYAILLQPSFWWTSDDKRNSHPGVSARRGGA